MYIFLSLYACHNLWLRTEEMPTVKFPQQRCLVEWLWTRRFILWCWWDVSGCFRRFVSWIAFGVEGGLLTAGFVHYIIYVCLIQFFCWPCARVIWFILVCNSYTQRVNKLCARVTLSGAFDVTIWGASVYFYCIVHSPVLLQLSPPYPCWICSSQFNRSCSKDAASQCHVLRNL